MKKLKFLNSMYSLMVKYYQVLSKIKRHLLMSIILCFILLEIITNILCKFNVFEQIGFFSGILSYGQFWSLVDALVAIIVPMKLCRPRVQIDLISTMSASDKPYGIYNRSNFGYMVELLGINVPKMPFFSKIRLLYKLRGGKSKQYYTLNHHVIDDLFNVYDHGFLIGSAVSKINKIEREQDKYDVGNFSKAERERDAFSKFLKCTIKQNYVKLRPYSVTFKSLYTYDLDRELQHRFNNNEVLKYRSKHGEPCMYYIVFRTPKGKLFLHRAFYRNDIYKDRKGNVSEDVHYDCFDE